MPFLDCFCAEGSVFRADVSRRCGVLVTRACKRQEDTRQAIAAGLDCGWSLPGLITNHNWAFGSSADTRDHGEGSSSTGRS